MVSSASFPCTECGDGKVDGMGDRDQNTVMMHVVLEWVAGTKLFKEASGQAGLHNLLKRCLHTRGARGTKSPFHQFQFHSVSLWFPSITTKIADPAIATPEKASFLIHWQCPTCCGETPCPFILLIGGGKMYVQVNLNQVELLHHPILC